MLRAALVRALLAAVIAPALGAQAPADRLVPTDVFNLVLASDPQISPDGKRVVYVRQFSDVMTDAKYTNLWIVNADGTDHRPLTTGKHSDENPRWSPDGKHLAYLSDEGGSSQIYVRWMDDGQTARVTNLANPPENVVWSPDGKSLAFASLVSAPAPSIATLPSPPAGATWAEPAKVIDKLVYRFDGAGYLPTGYSQIFVVPAQGGTPRQISSGSFHHGSGGGAFRASAPAWSPDGSAILVSAVRRPDYELEPDDSEIYEFQVADGRVTQLTHRKGPDDGPIVSPDGRLIAYTGYDDHYQNVYGSKLYVMNRDGSNSRLLTGSLDRDVGQPAWAADGSGLYYQYDDQGETKIGFVTLDGRSRVVVAGGIGTGASAYGGGSFSVASTGAVAYPHTSPNVPADVAVTTTAGTRVLTELNRGPLAGKSLGAVEEIWVTSPKGRERIEGWIVTPPGFDPTRKYPLILEIHGGPEANYGPRFDFEKQLWAAQGYVVLYLNPRGSTSYGDRFAQLIHLAYPGEDYDDLMAGVDFAIAKGSIDPDRLYVTGGSGGGVLTAWVIGHTTRFQAAAVAYPVINWESFGLTSDSPAWSMKYQFAAPPWENVRDNYAKRSLLSVVNQVKTPAMVITGEEDYRTPMSESEQYYAALKYLGVDAVLVRVPGEHHGIRKRPSHWMAKLMNIEGWFAKHRGSRT